MPRGVARKRTGREPPAPVQPITHVTLETLDKSAQQVVQAQFPGIGDELRARLMDHAEDVFETLVRCAKGQIAVQMYDKDGDSFVYSVPPSLTALKYLLDWARLLLQTDPAPAKNRHGLDDETKKVLQEFVEVQRVKPALPEQVGGAFQLGTAVVHSDD